MSVLGLCLRLPPLAATLMAALMLPVTVIATILAELRGIRKELDRPQVIPAKLGDQIRL